MNRSDSLICFCGGSFERSGNVGRFEKLQCCQCGSSHFSPKVDAGSLQIEEEVEFDYQAASAKYGEGNYLADGEVRWAHREIIFSLQENGERYNSCLEIGCYTGFFLAKLMEKRLIEKAAGFDLNPAALESGRHAWPNLKLTSTWSELSDRSPFDLIMCLDLLEHLEDPLEMLTSIVRLAGPGARVILAGPIAERRLHDKSDFPPHHRWWFTTSGFSKLAAVAGLNVDKVEFQYDAALMLRNFLGRILYGWSRREYYGDDDRIVAAANSARNPIVNALLRALTVLGRPLLRALNWPYCSIIVYCNVPESNECK